ncbi:MAG TPA: hypothetical protein EYP18_04750 [Desulfobacterales bacterium]|nr:hypothetical protein [Desulfobacterales bacterium]
MKNQNLFLSLSLFLFVAFLFLLPATSFAEKIFGGLTFTGDREGICIEIAGECATEDINFELATCDANNAEKEKFKKRMPFTILVPKGNHKIVIKKNGKELIQDEIDITPEKVLEYQLP